jgi:dipeptidyl aminopeptidase/acylaminoacyl peptidase
MTRARVSLLVLATLVPLEASAQNQPTGRPLRIEDYYRIRQVGSPEISADGNWVAFTVSRRIEATNGDSSEVWLVSANGSQPAQRISSPGEDARNPTWSDDGRVVYTAGGAGRIVDPRNPDEVRTANVRSNGGARSPDGRWVLVVRQQLPDRPAPPERSPFELRHEQRFRGAQFDWLNFQRDGSALPIADPRDPFANPAAEVFIVSLAGEEKQLTRLGLQPRSPLWTADGDLIVFLADSTYRDELTYPRSDVWTVTLDGTVQRLTNDPRYNNSSARLSLDGTRVAFVRTFATDHVIREKLNHGGPTDLWMMPVSGGPAVNLTANWDLQAGQPIWGPDGNWIWFDAETSGGRHLFRVPARGGRVEQITRGARSIDALNLDAGFWRMAYTVGVHHTPAEIHVSESDGNSEQRLTHIHDELTREIAFSRAQRLRYPSADGTMIEGWILPPYGYRENDEPYPLIVVSHGGPHSASGYAFNFRSQLFAANGYFVLETNFRSSTGYGEDFLWATWGGWGTKDGQDIIAGIDYVISRFPIDRNRVGHIGHSYGGFLSNWLITQYPDRFAAAVAGAGISNWISDYGTADIARTKETEFFGYPWDAEAREIMIRQSPITHAGNVRTPTLFVHGEVDQRVPYEEAEQMYTALMKRGVPAKMIVYAGMPHGISGHWNTVHRVMNELQWFDRWLKPD